MVGIVCSCFWYVFRFGIGLSWDTYTAFMSTECLVSEGWLSMKLVQAALHGNLTALLLSCYNGVAVHITLCFV